MHFEGELSVLEPATIFQIFNMSSLTGALKFITKRRMATFFFKEGQLIYATIDNKKKIGEVLVEQRMITRKQLEGALKFFRHDKGLDRIGKILVDRGYTDKRSLAHAIKEQMREVVYAVLNWDDGHFIFFKDVEPEDEDIYLDVRIDHLILEGLKRLDDRKSKKRKPKAKGKA